MPTPLKLEVVMLPQTPCSGLELAILKLKELRLGQVLQAVYDEDEQVVQV